MKSLIFGLCTAGTVFAIACAAQIFRLATHTDVMIAGREVPLWASGIAVGVAGALAIWMWSLAVRARRFSLK